jgi:hypothetical protein
MQLLGPGRLAKTPRQYYQLFTGLAVDMRNKR